MKVVCVEGAKLELDIGEVRARADKLGDLLAHGPDIHDVENGGGRRRRHRNFQTVGAVGDFHADAWRDHGEPARFLDRRRVFQWSRFWRRRRRAKRFGRLHRLGGEDRKRVDRRAVANDFEMKMRAAAGSAGRADAADGVARLDAVAFFHLVPIKMGVARHQPVAVIDDDDVAPCGLTAIAIGRLDHLAVAGCADNRAARGGDVDAGMVFNGAVEINRALGERLDCLAFDRGMGQRVLGLWRHGQRGLREGERGGGDDAARDPEARAPIETGRAAP